MIACLAIAVLVVMVNFSSLLTNRVPATAASLFYANATARGRLAQQMIVAKQTPDVARSALALAQSAVVRDPTVAIALSAAGYAFGQLGQPERAWSSLQLANRLSRRILLVQLWLIENAVQRGDIVGALHQYDIALRTNRETQAILFPILNGAIEEPLMAHSVARLLAGNPAWRSDFTSQLVNLGPLSGTTRLAVILAQIGSPLPDEYANVLMLRLSGVRDYTRAQAIFRANFPEEARADVLVRDPTFVRSGTALPFGWQFSDDGELGIAPGRSGGAQLYAKEGRSGEAARQLVTLRPGAYRLAAGYADTQVTQGAEPRWQVVCASEAATKLVELPLVAGSGRRAVTAALQIPAQDCAAQWIFMIVPVGASDDSLSIDLVSLTIERLK